MMTGLGLLSAASFPPVSAWPLSVVSLALLLWFVRGRPSAEARNLGLIYGLAYGLGVCHWLFRLFGGLMAVPLIAIFGAYFWLLFYLIGLTREDRPLWRGVEVALFAVAVEWLRGDVWYLRFPWYTVPHALAAEPACIAGVRWVGVYGLSFVIWLIAAWGAFVRPWFWLGFLLLPACALILPSFDPPDQHALLIQTEESDGGFTIIPGVEAKKIDLAVLPEYATYGSPKAAIASTKGPAALARRFSSPVVFGAVEGDYGGPDFRNVAVVLDGEGKQIGTFTKQHPVPLVADGVRGTERPVFPVENGTLGVAICYDFDAPAVASSLARSGATVFVDPTYDGIDWGWIQHEHHEQLLRLRAVEDDRWILRAASSGRTEAIDPHGRPSRDGVEIGGPGYVVVEYGHRHGVTLGAWAAFAGPVTGMLSIAILGWRGVGWWRRRRLP